MGTHVWRGGLLMCLRWMMLVVMVSCLLAVHASFAADHGATVQEAAGHAMRVRVAALRMLRFIHY